MGKTVALGLLADELARAPADPIPLLISAPSWSRSGKSLLNFAAEQVDGAASATHFLQLRQSGAVAILLNGWNEIASDLVVATHSQLADFRRAAPAGPIIVTARSRSSTDPLRCSMTWELTRLSRAARRQIIEQLAGTDIDRIETELTDNEHAEHLSRLPLFLIAMIDALLRGDKLPTTRYGILESALLAIEKAPDHREALWRRASGSGLRAWRASVARSRSRSSWQSDVNERGIGFEIHRQCQRFGRVARHLRRVSPCTYKRDHRVARIHVVINDKHAADTGYFAICTEILPRYTSTGTHLMFSARAHFLKSGGKL